MTGPTDKMKAQARMAEDFRSLHKGTILVLPNAWDVPSARVFEDAGFPAVATSSAGVTVSLGYRDGEEIGIENYVSAVERIASALSVPLSADVVGGFGDSPSEAASSVKSVISAGAIGINIEDFVHQTKKLLPVQEQVQKLRALVALKDSMKIPFVINARTDALRFATGDDKGKLEEAISRGRAYRDAGADCVYPMGLTEPTAISEYVKALSFPVNVMVRAGLPPIGELRRLGVARVSFGPSASYAAMGLLARASREVLDKGTYQTLLEGALSFDQLNELATKRR